MSGANQVKEKMMMKKKKGKEEEQFEFCQVCRFNHSNGRQHIYFPNHAKSRSAFLSRFSKKLSDVRFFLKHPSLLSPEHAAKNGFWCVFCEVDVSGIGSCFACENAIKHLASNDHLANVKSFMWKHGGEKKEIDLYRILESDAIKWEIGCKALKNSLPSEGSSMGHAAGLLNDIQPTQNSVNKDTIYISVNSTHESSVSNGVLPLQCHTNERHQISYSGSDGVVGSLPRSISASNNTPFFYTCNGVEVREWDSWNNATLDVHRFSQIPQVPSEGPVANVHTGAPPPWLDSKDQIEFNAGTWKFCKVNELQSELPKMTSKLNPKRVGAAWAEKRKFELEREKRGEVVSSHCGEDWLPNFGRVWQSGSRKESRKEFEVEKLGERESRQVKLPVISSITVQPYVSKRMRAEKNLSTQNGVEPFE